MNFSKFVFDNFHWPESGRIELRVGTPLSSWLNPESIREKYWLSRIYYLFFHYYILLCLYRAGPRPPHSFSSWPRFVCKFSCQGSTQAPAAYSIGYPLLFWCILSHRLTQLFIVNIQNQRTQSVIIQLYKTALARGTNFPYSSVSPSWTHPGSLRRAVLVQGVPMDLVFVPFNLGSGIIM